jgi:hypothetical protein
MKKKEIRVSFYRREFTRDDWHYPLDPQALESFFARFAEELAAFGIRLCHGQEDAVTLQVQGYGDLLNSVRLRSPQDGFSNLCLGHVIGASPNRDLFEDIRRGVNRIAFAPETVEPEGSSKVVCHNCGCGC